VPESLQPAQKFVEIWALQPVLLSVQTLEQVVCLPWEQMMLAPLMTQLPRVTSLMVKMLHRLRAF
jgi:hypothetical protein